MFFDNELMPDQDFVQWLTEKEYVLQHTGSKNCHRLCLDGEWYSVTGLERTTRKKLKITQKPDPYYYRIHPLLADRWERLTFDEYWALNPGETVYVLYDALTIKEGIFHFASPLAASVVSICEGRPTIGHFHLPEEPERETWKIWARFHRKKA